MTLLAALLLPASLVVLTIQVLLIRQIGILSSRMGPDPDQRKPGRTKVEKIDLLDGGARRLLGGSPTPLLILSVGCHLCARVLADLSSRLLPEGLVVGVLGGREDIEELVTRLPVDRGRFFDAGRLATDLDIKSVPLYLRIDSALNVTERTFVDSLDAVGGLLEKHERPLEELPSH